MIIVNKCTSLLPVKRGTLGEGQEDWWMMNFGHRNPAIAFNFTQARADVSDVCFGSEVLNNSFFLLSIRAENVA